MGYTFGLYLIHFITNSYHRSHKLLLQIETAGTEEAPLCFAGLLAYYFCYMYFRIFIIRLQLLRNTIQKALLLLLLHTLYNRKVHPIEEVHSVVGIHKVGLGIRDHSVTRGLIL